MPKPSLVLMFVNMMTYFRRRLPAALAHSRVGGADAAPESIRHRAEQGRARGTRSQGAEVYAPYPIKMSDSPSDVKHSPLLGEHTDARSSENSATARIRSPRCALKKSSDTKDFREKK